MRMRHLRDEQRNPRPIFSLLVLLVLLAVPSLSTADAYPRLALRTGFVQRWVTEMDSAAFLGGFDMIFTDSPPSRVVTVKDSLTTHSLPHPDFVYMFEAMCVRKADDLEDPQNPGFLVDWAYDLAKESWQYLSTVAVYHNLQAGADWILHDSGGYPICVWGGSAYPCTWKLLNHSPWCPKGLWKGVVQKGSNAWDFGSTEGLTVTEWVSTVVVDSIFGSPAFLDAFCGVDCEDGPSREIPCWGGYRPGGGAISNPDPKNDGIGIPCDSYNPLPSYADSCRASTDSLFTEFLQVLRDSLDLRVMQNGHRLKWHVLGTGWEDTMVTNTFTGCKLEDFGKWGGWPQADSTNAYWWRVYKGTEEVYLPTGVDSLEGWDFTLVESTPWADDGVGEDWSLAKRDKWTRLNLGISMMGDGYFAGQAYFEDFAFAGYLWGDAEYGPFSIPESDFKFSGTASSYGCYTPWGTVRSVLYRHFNRIEEGQSAPYTVVVNTWPQTTGGVPGRDSQWFRGHHSTFPQPDSLLVFDHWDDDEGRGLLPTESLLGVSVDRRDRGAQIRFTLAHGGPVNLTVFDASGRRVQTLLDRRLGPGSHSVVWDGLDQNGHPASKGLYFWNLTADEANTAGRFLLVH